MLAMIDKCGFERRACVNSGMQVTLCDFHGVSLLLLRASFCIAGDAEEEALPRKAYVNIPLSFPVIAEDRAETAPPTHG